MFKFTIAIAALAVSASLAISVPDNRQWSSGPMQQRPMMLHQQGQSQPQPQGLYEPTAAATSKQKPTKVMYVTEVKDAPGYGIGALLESALYKLIKVPKKVAGAVAGLIVGKLKSLGAAGLMKAALLAGLVAVIGAVVAVVTISVAGLVSVVTGICATVLHFKQYLGGGKAGAGDEGGAGGRSAESQIDYISEFVLGAFEKYGEQQ